MGHGDILEISIDELRPGRYQPRTRVHEETMAELADSIREQGVLQPLIVRVIHLEPHAESREAETNEPPTEAYEIVAGERRWRAAQLAGLATVPAIVRELDDQSALAVALVENLQREDLNPIDQARSMAQLVEEFDLTHEQIAKALGRSRASVTNFLRLLDLADDVKDAIAGGVLDMGHARALLPLDHDRQVAMARKVARLGWSVRQVEKAVQALVTAPAGDESSRSTVDLQTRWLASQLAREIGEKISIRPGPKGDYVLTIGFGDLAGLATTLERLEELVRQIRETAGPRQRERARADSAAAGSTPLEGATSSAGVAPDEGSASVEGTVPIDSAVSAVGATPAEPATAIDRDAERAGETALPDELEAAAAAPHSKLA